MEHAFANSNSQRNASRDTKTNAARHAETYASSNTKINSITNAARIEYSNSNADSNAFSDAERFATITARTRVVVATDAPRTVAAIAIAARELNA